MISETTALRAYPIAHRPMGWTFFYFAIAKGPLPLTRRGWRRFLRPYPLSFRAPGQHFHNFIVTFATYGVWTLQGVGGSGEAAV